MAAQGISLHIGVDNIDNNHYVDMNPLKFCVADARAMQKLAEDQGFDTTLLVNEQATRDGVEKHITQAAQTLKAGDMYLITFAGHGCQLPDINEDESMSEDGFAGDMYDETWCLYDAQQLDDERAVFWSKFREGVRVCIVSDSCHSGTASRGGGESEAVEGVRSATRGGAQKTYDKWADMYDSLQRTPPEHTAAEVLLLSGCQDHQTAKEKVEFEHGSFTYGLLNVWQSWQERNINGDYATLRAEIDTLLSDPKQQPNLMPEDAGFVGEHPFKI